MNYSALIQSRKSFREYADKKVALAQLKAIRTYYRNSVRRLIPEIKTQLYLFGTEARLGHSQVDIIEQGKYQQDYTNGNQYRDKFTVASLKVGTFVMPKGLGKIQFINRNKAYQLAASSPVVP